jgi:hypothetical protein
VFELTLPLGTAPASAPCPECGEGAPRIFTAPLTAAPSLDESGPFGMTQSATFCVTARVRTNASSTTLTAPRP